MTPTCIDLRERFGQKYRIGFDEAVETKNDPWMMTIHCRWGTIYPHGAELLALVATGAWLANRRSQNLAVAAAAASPVAIVALLFPDGGTQPFHTASFAEVCAVEPDEARRQAARS